MRSKSMGIGAMFVLFVAVVVLLPMFVRFVSRMTGEHYIISGFRDGPDDQVAMSSTGVAAKLPTWRPDHNTDYLCRSPNEDGNPCPEGTFCDGVDQSCKPLYVGGPVPDMGYYA